MTRFTVATKPYRAYNNFVDELLNDLPAFFKNDFNKSARNESVPVNVKETEENYRLEVVAPGFGREDFKVSVEQNILTVSAEKTQGAETKNEKEIRREFSLSSFKRSFTIDEKIDATRIEASYVNGVLVLNLPKKVEVKESARKIEIK